MSSQSYLFNPTERTLAAAGDGFSAPRLTTTDRLALSLGVNGKGMMVYDTTLTTLCLWNGTAWEYITDNSNGVYSVKDFGAKGDGVTDDTAAIQAAINATGISGGSVCFPSGTYIVTSTLTVKEGVRLWGVAAAKQTTPTSATGNQVFLVHDFSGTFINVVSGTIDQNENSGFGLTDISLVQRNGNGTGASGTAVNIVATSETQRANWIVFNNVNIETESGKNDWNYGINIDGTSATTGCRNIWIDKTRIVSAANSFGSIRLVKAFNVFISNTMCNLANANISVSGASSAVYIQNSTFNAIAVDSASYVQAVGVAAATISTTGSSSNCTFFGDVTTSISMGSASSVFMGSVAGTVTFQNGGSNAVFKFPSNLAIFQNAANVVSGTQIVAQGGDGGYGAGFSMRSVLSGTSTLKEMARWAADGEAAWNSTAANQDASLGGWVTEDGVETKVVKFRKPSSAGQTAFYIFDYDNNQIEQVTVGAADSAGLGFKLLRIPN